MTVEEFPDAVARLSDLLTPGDLDDTLRRITRAAVVLLPDVEDASITISHADGRLETIAATSPVLERLDNLQYELAEGPCYYAAIDQVNITSPDLATDERFPRYAQGAVEAGFGAQAGLRLFERVHSRSAINLYSREVGAFADLEAIGVAFAEQSATALDYAREIGLLRDAMATRGTIGQAVGVLMERYGLTDVRAFAFLTRISQDRNIKLRKVAGEVVASVRQEPDA